MATFRIAGTRLRINGPLTVTAGSETGEKGWTTFDIMLQGINRTGDKELAYITMSYSELISLQIALKPYLDDNNAQQMQFAELGDVKSAVGDGPDAKAKGK